MKRKLSNKEIYTIIQAEEELGCSCLVYDLSDNPNLKVYAEVSKNGVINIDTYELREK